MRKQSKVALTDPVGKKVLLIEDDPVIRSRLAASLELFKFEVTQAENGHDGLTFFRNDPHDIVLTDLKMPILDGKGVLSAISSEYPETPIIVVSGMADIRDAIEAVHLGAWDYIVKPIYDIAVLKYSIVRSLERADLLKTNREYRETLEKAKMIMDRDMRMAINVQNKYLPKKTPRSAEWDISYEFKPMEGISGDFYDFYENEKMLSGISLFDVSGHGIASGLITMISKSIIFRCYNNMKDSPLNKVVERVNQDLIAEIDNMDNYLTGVMLRFQSDMVEYVNAGHPSIMHRMAGTGNVVMPGENEGYENGSFLGMSTVAGDYNLHTFNVQRNDVLLLFSDCLIEAVNPENKRFGMSRLKDALKKVPEGENSKKILKYILEDLYEFTGQVNLPDDLTVIVAKRLGQ